MTDRLLKLTIFILCGLVPVSVPEKVTAGEPRVAMPVEHTAVYDVIRKGEGVAKVTLELSRQGDSWIYRGFTHDMHGLAKLLNAEGQQSVTGTWVDGMFQPDEFKFSFSVIGYRSRWQAEFDWLQGTVSTGKKSRKSSFSLADGAMDPMSLFLNTGALLATGQTRMDINLVDEDEIESHLYEAESGVRLDTALGCMDTTRVRRIRENSKRTSLAWYATDFAYLPVRLQHYKKEGKGLEVRIRSLQLEGVDVREADSCESATG